MIAHLKEIVQNKSGRAIGIIFACSGLVFGSWASFIPYIKEKFNLDEAQLGLLLLSMPVGILLVNPVSVLLIRFWGAVATSLWFVVLTGFAFMLPVVMDSITFVVIGLMLSGACFGITNVSMNTCASALESSSRLRLIAACHGMWSFGAMMGALLSGFSLLPLEQCCSEIIDPQKLYVLLQALLVCMIIWLLPKDLHHINPEQIPEKSGSKFNIRIKII